MVVPAAPSDAADAFIGLGSNLGDRLAELERAFAEIAALPATQLAARSSYYESAPLNAAGDDYLNAVAQVRTALSPIALLEALQAIEFRHGRVRPFANAPRTLDLDLLLHGEVEMKTPELVLPHPRLHERAFVLLPLAEIVPALVVPGRGAVQSLAGRVAAQRIARLTRTP
jgi:2-amino-4-hydroxy-6-hydroxymethyldihydropteridine diphosphokinase